MVEIKNELGEGCQAFPFSYSCHNELQVFMKTYFLGVKKFHEKFTKRVFFYLKIAEKKFSRRKFCPEVFGFFRDFPVFINFVFIRNFPLDVMQTLNMKGCYAIEYIIEKSCHLFEGPFVRRIIGLNSGLYANMPKIF